MTQKRFFYISAGGYFVSSLSVLIMPFGDITGQTGSRAVAILSALIFWLALIIAVTARALLWYIQKPHRKKNSLQSFLKNLLFPPTVWTASAFGISLIATVILSIFNINGYILYFCIFLMLLSFEWTALSNGKFTPRDGLPALKTYRLINPQSIKSQKEQKQ